MVERTATIESGWDALARGVDVARRPGPFALSAEGALEQLAASAGLTVTERASAVTAWEYADGETALRGLLAPGPAVRAGMLEALAPFRTREGVYRLENTFVYVVAGG